MVLPSEWTMYDLPVLETAKTARANTCHNEGPWLDVVVTIPAGASADRTLRSGEAARIFTGAPVPAGADAVVMQEQTATRGRQVQINTAPRAGQNIRREGEDVQAGAVVLRAGSVLNALDCSDSLRLSGGFK